MPADCGCCPVSGFVGIYNKYCLSGQLAVQSTLLAITHFPLMSCMQVWVDGHKKARGDYSYLTLWKPIAPAGYVAMGLLASLGGREPASLDKVCYVTTTSTELSMPYYINLRTLRLLLSSQSDDLLCTIQ